MRFLLILLYAVILVIAAAPVVLTAAVELGVTMPDWLYDFMHYVKFYLWS